MTLKDWQIAALPRLRSQTFALSRHFGVTIIVYTFPPSGREDEAFRGIECSILQTWSVLGRIPTVIVADRHFPALDAFLEKWHARQVGRGVSAEPPQIQISYQQSEIAPLVSLRLSSMLVPCDIRSMSLDCIAHLKDYFSTPSCLVIQNDGFPLRDTLDDFLGKFDFIGAPTNVGWRRRFIFRPLGLMTFNGGFSLRSHRICEAAAAAWQHWGRHLIHPKGRLFAEDVFFTTTAKFNPLYRFHFRFPRLAEALRFSYDDLRHLQDLPAPVTPFGFHGVTTAERYLS